MREDALTEEQLVALEADVEVKGGGGLNLGGNIPPPVARAPISTNKDIDSAPQEALELNDAEQSQTNVNLLLDVQVQVTVELGRVTKTVGYILALGEGSIIELDKPANEPVELLVNDRLIARGEVVVIDENFGVRITEIIDPNEKTRKFN